MAAAHRTGDRPVFPLALGDRHAVLGGAGHTAAAAGRGVRCAAGSAPSGAGPAGGSHGDDRASADHRTHQCADDRTGDPTDHGAHGGVNVSPSADHTCLGSDKSSDHSSHFRGDGSGDFPGDDRCHDTGDGSGHPASDAAINTASHDYERHGGTDEQPGCGRSAIAHAGEPDANSQWERHGHGDDAGPTQPDRHGASGCDRNDHGHAGHDGAADRHGRRESDSRLDAESDGDGGHDLDADTTALGKSDANRDVTADGDGHIAAQSNGNRYAHSDPDA
jgi:hypothetical protein